jgi:hypothetical protein
MEPLDGTRLKLKRANHHIDALNQCVNNFRIDHRDLSIRVQDDFEGQTYILEVKQDIVPPIEWGLIIGDVVTNLRASLDYLVCDLVRAKKATPTNRNQFPIFNSRTQYSTDGTVYMEHLDQPVMDCLERFQPYNRVNWPEVELLWILHNLTNSDKHQVLTQTFGQGRIELEGSLLPHPIRLQQGNTYMFTQFKKEGKFERELQPRFVAEIIFDSSNPVFDGKEVKVLDDIYQFISNEVVPRFKGFFK